jgi:hypothetical protein
MRIKVQYQDKTFGKIEAYLHDDLIRKKKIKKFRRSGKWVIIGVDPIREVREKIFEIPQKTKSNSKIQKKK